MSVKILSADALIPLYTVTEDWSGMLYIDYMRGQLYNIDLTKVDDDFNEAVLDHLRNRQFSNYYEKQVPEEALVAAMEEIQSIERPAAVDPPKVENED